MAKNYLPKYRQAIALALESKRIPLTNLNSHEYTYFKDGEEHTTTEHWALTYLKYARAAYEQFARSTTKNNNLKQDSLQPVNPHRYLETVSSLLDSDDPFELAIALAAVTGRRYSEIMARGHFAPTDHPYQIRFSGQLKKRSAVDSYTTFTLVPTEQVLSTLNRFRTHPTISSLQNASIEEINQFNTPINRLVKHHFQATNLVPVLVSEAGVTIQNLRSIYGEIAVYLFCPSDLGVHRFIQQRLGHLITDPELSHGKNSGSTEHYFHYYLVDRHGQPLTSKGILRQQSASFTTVVPLKLEEEEKLEETEAIENRKEAEIEQLELDTTLKPLIEPVAATTTLPSRPDSTTSSDPDMIPSTPDPSPLNSGAFLRCITALINSDDYQHLLVGLMAATGLDAASLLKLLVFKEVAAPHLILYCQQLHSPLQPFHQLITLLPAEAILSAISRLRRHPDALDFAHQRTGSEITAEVAQFIPSVLSSVGLDSHLILPQHYQSLVPLLFQSHFALDSTLSLHSDTYSQFAQWQQHFSADVDTTLHELMRLASTALQSSSQPTAKTSPLAPPSQKSIPPLARSLDSAPLPSPPPSQPSPWLAISRLTEAVASLTHQVVEQNDRLINLHSSSTLRTPTQPPSTSTQPKSPFKPRSSVDVDSIKHLTGDELKSIRAPMAKLTRALNGIIRHNQQQSEPKTRWRINTNVLQRLTGCFNASVKHFVQQHQDQIEQHNQQFGLTTVRHNAIYKGQDPNLFIKW